MLLDGAAPAEALSVMRSFLATLTDPVVADGHELLVRASIGIAHGTTGDDPVELLRRADIAMYAAKRTGGGGALSYHPDMAGEALDSAAAGAQLRHAVGAGQLFLE